MSVLMSFLSQAAPHWVIVVVLVLLAILGASTLNYLEGRYEQSLKGKVVDRSEHGETKEVFDGDEDDTEFIGQVIDIFEDFLDIKDGVVKSDDSGVRIAGSDYDFLADRISDLMIAWF